MARAGRRIAGMGIDRAILAGFDWGARSANVVAALWPDRCRAQVSVSGYLIGLAAGESRYDDLERRLADAPAIAVPTITLEGDANGAPHADVSAYAGKFSGKYEHRVIEGGVGHDLPHEAPQAFAPGGHRRRRLLTDEAHGSGHQCGLANYLEPWSSLLQKNGTPLTK